MALQEFPSYRTLPDSPGGISVRVWASWESLSRFDPLGEVRNFLERSMARIEPINQRTTCKVRLGITKDKMDTAIALTPIVRATKAVGKTTSIEQRITPASNQIKVIFGINL
jgi:hypothetical protein